MDLVRLESDSFAGKFDEYGTIVLSGGYLYDSENKDAIEACIDVFENSKCGLILIGNPGSGKTLFFEMCRRIIPATDPRNFVMKNVLDIVLEFNDKAIGHKVFRKWEDKNVFFDDLGTEDVGHLYGEKVEVFEKFIQFRYELWRNKGLKTHFTTNLSGSDIKQRYGARCYSRLCEMCQIQIIGGSADSSDRRKLRNFKGLPFVHHKRELTDDELEMQLTYEALKAKAKETPPQERTGLGSRMRKILGTD